MKGAGNFALFFFFFLLVVLRNFSTKFELLLSNSVEGLAVLWLRIPMTSCIALLISSPAVKKGHLITYIY